MNKRIGVLLIGFSVLLMGSSMLWMAQSSSTVVADLSRSIITPASPVATQSPVANDSWWTARWLSMQNGKSVDTTVKKPLLASKGLVAYAAMDEENQMIEVVCTGGTGEGVIRLQNFQSTKISQLSKVRIAVECVLFSGTQTMIVNPTMCQLYIAETDQRELVIILPDMVQSQAYHIVISPTGTESLEEFAPVKTVRYEAEDGTLFGSATIVENAFATSGKGIVGAITSKDAGVEIKAKVADNGTYRLDLLFQNETDSTAQAETYLMVDGKKAGKITVPSFLKKGESASISCELELERGKHTIAVQQEADGQVCTGTVALDCMDVTYLYGQQQEPPVVPSIALVQNEQTSETQSSFLLIAPNDGYYELTFFCNVNIGESVTYLVDGVPVNQISLNTKSDPTSTVKLGRGVHQVDVVHDGTNRITSISFLPAAQAENGT